MGTKLKKKSFNLTLFSTRFASIFIDLRKSVAYLLFSGEFKDSV